jgi:hypothetical protein
LVERWERKAEMGSLGLFCSRRTIFSPLQFDFVRGRKRVWAIRLSKERLKCALDGLDSVDKSEEEEERSSPSQHWLQKATRAQARIATSLGCVRSRWSTRRQSMAIVMGGRRGSLEEEGVMFLAPLRITRRRRLLFQGAL